MRVLNIFFHLWKHKMKVNIFILLNLRQPNTIIETLDTGPSCSASHFRCFPDSIWQSLEEVSYENNKCKWMFQLNCYGRCLCSWFFLVFCLVLLSTFAPALPTHTWASCVSPRCLLLLINFPSHSVLFLQCLPDPCFFVCYSCSCQVFCILFAARSIFLLSLINIFCFNSFSSTSWGSCKSITSLQKHKILDEQLPVTLICLTCNNIITQKSVASITWSHLFMKAATWGALFHLFAVYSTVNKPPCPSPSFKLTPRLLPFISPQLPHNLAHMDLVNCGAPLYVQCSEEQRAVFCSPAFFQVIKMI